MLHWEQHSNSQEVHSIITLISELFGKKKKKKIAGPFSSTVTLRQSGIGRDIDTHAQKLKMLSIKHNICIYKDVQHAINICHGLKPTALFSSRTECSVPLLVGTGFYGAIKLGVLYRSNSMKHYCFLHLLLIKWFSIAKMVQITIHTGSRACFSEDASFYLWHWGSLAENFEVDYTLFTAIIEFWKNV